MSTLDGIFTLRTPIDLLGKLEADFQRIESSNPDIPSAHYAAFDFFVTAEHLPDWVMHTYGGSLTSYRGYPDGALVSHIANGAKHFHVRDVRHKEAKGTAITGCFDPSVFDSSFDVRRLIILLESGESVDVLDVAERVIDHWRGFLNGFSVDLGDASS